MVLMVEEINKWNIINNTNYAVLAKMLTLQARFYKSIIACVKDVKVLVNIYIIYLSLNLYNTQFLYLIL